MGKEYGRTPSSLMNHPHTLDTMALDEAIFWMGRAQDLEADTRRTMFRSQQAQSKARGKTKGWTGPANAG